MPASSPFQIVLELRMDSYFLIDERRKLKWEKGPLRLSPNHDPLIIQDY